MAKMDVDTTIELLPREDLFMLILTGLNRTPILHLLPVEVKVDISRMWANACNEKFSLDSYSISNAYQLMMITYKKTPLFSVMNEDNIRAFVEDAVWLMEKIL